MCCDRTIKVKLNNFLFNAAIVGFYGVIKGSEGVKIDGNTLEFPTSVFEGFEGKYVEALYSKFEETTVWYELSKRYVALKYKIPETENIDKEIEVFSENMIEKLSRNSYKSGYEIIKTHYGDKTLDVLAEIKLLKKAKVSKERIEIISRIMDYITKYKQVFCLKDIVYTKIINFWQGVSFLNTGNSQRDITKCYYDHFVVPVNKYLNNTLKGKYSCMECGNPVQASAASTSWINDMGVDIARKKSYYWNFIPDSYLCPVCNIIYSCIPLGFLIAEREGIFINNNDSLKGLIESNNTIGISLENLEKTENEIYMKILNSIIQSENETTYKEIENIQVIKRRYVDNDTVKYVMNILSLDKLKTLKRCRYEFSFLVPFGLSVDKKNYMNIYEKVMENFFGAKNQYGLLNFLINFGLREQKRMPYLMNILYIQNKVKREVKNMGVIKDDLDKIRCSGYEIRSHYSSFLSKSEGQNKGVDVDNKLRAYSYKLLNALKTKNVNYFMDTAIRMYTGLGKSVPDLFLKMIKNEDAFLELGYAYIIGLKGDSKNEEKENKSGEEVSNG